jgi:hypothetical protein
MGCFSFICQKSDKAVLSSSFSGDAVHLFLLKNGKVIEHMFGNYDSYGRVFSNVKDPDDRAVTDKTSFKWKMEWGDVCDLMFSSNTNNGIAAILAPYWKEGDPYPTERSEDDPNQGWGERMELIGYCGKDIGEPVDEAYHKTYY